MPIDVPVPNFLYEDPYLAVLYKPAGLLVHPTSSRAGLTVASWLMDYKSQWSTVGGEGRAGIVHRLDQDTEGLMVVAKTDEIHLALSDQFKQRQVQKRYYAVVSGDLRNDIDIEKPIGYHRRRYNKRQIVTMNTPGAKEALTSILVLKRYNTKTLVDAIPKTGRTHQIRVHLASIGHAVLGDPLYGTMSKNAASGQLLQSYYLGFFHPVIKEHWAFQVPISKRLGV